MNKFSVTIETQQAGQRLDKVLGDHPLVGSRSQARRLIKNQFVCGNEQKTLKASHLVSAGEVFEVSWSPEPSEPLHPFDLPLDIVFEDQDLIVINKPSGLSVHPSTTEPQGTLVNALLAYTTDLSMGYGEQRPGIVHRLDKGTSGLLVIAKNNTTHRHLAEQFKEKTAHRVYWAVVLGHPQPNHQTVKSFLHRHPTLRRKFASVRNSRGQILRQEDLSKIGRWAVTHFQTEQTHPAGLALLHLKLETGRTHQIRVHLSEIGHPIVGDPIYSSSKQHKQIRSVTLRKMIDEMPRFALHAAELGFVHPRSNEFVCFKASWPTDLLNLVEHCGFGFHHP